jgi:hypothetical protein
MDARLDFENRDERTWRIDRGSPAANAPAIGHNLQATIAHAADRAAIPCRKSETTLSLTHETILRFFMLRPLAPVPPTSPIRPENCENFIFSKIQRNPLKRLDSDERIQRNPSFSNPLFSPFSPWNADRPRKSKPDRPKGGGRRKGQAAG